MMATVANDLIQHAKQTAEAQALRIRPSPTLKGWIVWHVIPNCGWQSIAQFIDRDDAEAFVFSTIAIWGD